MIPATIDFAFSTIAAANADVQATDALMLELSSAEIMMIGGGENLVNNL